MGKIKIKFSLNLADISDMKKLALTIIISVAGVALSAEEYTIQTISALKEGSITPAFEKKVQTSALSVTKKKEGACNVVTVGHYDNPAKARADLAKARKIAKDAFVRPVARIVPKACASTVAEKKKEKGAKTDSNATVKTPVKAEIFAESSKDAVPSSGPAAAVSKEMPKEIAVASATVSVTAESKAEPKAAEPPVAKGEPSEKANQTAVFIYDRNLVRKSDIHEAIEYYRNSPYHTFKPIAMQR